MDFIQFDRRKHKGTLTLPERKQFWGQHVGRAIVIRSGYRTVSNE